ncbi:MAG TPA: ACT domain-containing protein, partial [Chthoniobacteraceae bacterium]|nr:ACT domain-containing protein [Chthoniobacteraceae bacterium]
ALAIETPRRGYGFTPHELYGKCKCISSVTSQYYLRLSVDDKPGVLAQIAGILGENEIGISSVIQPEAHEEADVQLVLMIHDATSEQMQKALERIAALGCVKKKPRLIRVENFNK